MAKTIIKTSKSNNRDIERIEVKELGVKFKFSKKYALIIIVLIILALIPSVYFYNQYQTAKNLLQSPKDQTSAQTRALVDTVGKLIELPTNEQPKLATVTDVTQLEGQPFFAKAKNGDKVLIYAQAGKAILFRESINKIIEVAPVNTSAGNTQTQQINPSPVQNQSATVTILNGTLAVSLAKTAQTKIQENISNITISQTGDSLNGNYQQTVVVDVSGKNAAAASAIANLLNAKVENSVPTGERQPTSDILVILGSDFVK